MIPQIIIPRLIIGIWFFLSANIGVAQSDLEKTLDRAFVSGTKGFAEYLSKTIKYPFDARSNGIMGLSVFSFRVNCAGRPGKILFKTKLGFEIENRITEAIDSSVGKWISCDKRDTAVWMNLKIAFSLNQLYKSADANIVVNAMGNFPGVSDDTLRKDLDRATQKNNKEKMLAALTRLVMRFPYNQEYKKKLAILLEK